MTGQYLTGTREIPVPERAPAGLRQEGQLRSSARAQQPQERHRRDSARHFTCVTGVSGGGKSTLVIETLYKAAGRAPERRPRRIPAKHTTRSRASSTLDKVIDIDQSPIGRTPRSNPRPTPAPSRRSATGSPACPKPRRAATRTGPLQLQRQGRPLRGLPGRRRDQDRDALPARRLRHLRRLQGQALQPRDARDPLQGQVDRRHPRHDRRGGRRLLQGRAVGPPTSWTRSSASASATSTSASRPPPSPAARRSV